MRGNCARREVTCTLVTPGGERIVGKNWCKKPQTVCPRTEDEDYTKCKTVCDQWGHAEEVAVLIAGPKAMGATAIIEGHSYACRNCQEALFAAGVSGISVAKQTAPEAHTCVPEASPAKKRRTKTTLTPEIRKQVMFVMLQNPGMSQEGIAKVVGVGQTTVSRILRLAKVA